MFSLLYWQLVTKSVCAGAVQDKVLRTAQSRDSKLSAWSRARPESLTGAYLVQKLCSYGVRNLIIIESNLKKNVHLNSSV
jgi:hypothetical protein